MFRIMSNINVSAARSSLLTRLLALQPPVYTATTVSKDLCVGRMFPYQVHIVDDVQVRQNNRPQVRWCRRILDSRDIRKCPVSEYVKLLGIPRNNEQFHLFACSED